MEEFKFTFDIDATMSAIETALRNQGKLDISRFQQIGARGGDGRFDVVFSPAKSGRARLAITADEKDIEELCARVSTYRPESLPISSFLHLMTVSSGRGELPSMWRPIRKEALFGLAIGELATRVEGGFSPDAISFSRLSRTFSFCYSEFTSNPRVVQLEEVWNRWLNARSMLGNENVPLLEGQVFGCIGLIDHAVRQNRFGSMSPIVDALASTHPTDEIVFHLQRYAPELQEYLDEFAGPLEERMRAFDKCVLAVHNLSIEAIEKSIFVAALANLLQPGSGAYFGLLRLFAQSLPALYLWYGYLSGADGQGEFAERMGAIFCKFVDAIQTECSVAAHKANVDYCELVVLNKARELDSLRRVADSSFVAINIEDGIIAHVPFASRLGTKSDHDGVELVPREHVDSLLSGVELVLRLGEELGYKVTRAGADAKRGVKNKSSSSSTKSTKERQKTLMDEGGLF